MQNIVNGYGLKKYTTVYVFTFCVFITYEGEQNINSQTTPSKFIYFWLYYTTNICPLIAFIWNYDVLLCM